MRKYKKSRDTELEAHMYVHAGIPRNTKQEAIIYIKGAVRWKKRQNELLTKYHETKNPQEC